MSAAHDLVPLAHVDNVATASCSCGEWKQSWYTGGALPPRWSDVVHAHQTHARKAAAEAPPVDHRTGLDALTAMAQAIAHTTAAMQAAGERLNAIMESFAAASKAATKAGHGVVVVRYPDGTVTSTVNVHLDAGTVTFMDAPGAPDTPAPHDWLPRMETPVAPLPHAA